MKKSISVLQKVRYTYKPKLPKSLRLGANVGLILGEPTSSVADQDKIKTLFPNTFGLPVVKLSQAIKEFSKIVVNVGVVLSGGQAPGGHNVISGLFDGLKSINPNNKLYGFLGGPSGLIDNKYTEITVKLVDEYRNTGGFDMIGSGRTKLETTEQFEKTAANCKKLGINAIVIIGGDDSNTNACLLAEYFCAKKNPIQVIGCPKTIDGDLKNEQIETSFGFDTACRVYSELIGNLQRDAISGKKYWHFIKLMGRSASHITLECALQAHPNVALIGEEVVVKNIKLTDIINAIIEIIVERSNKEKNYGVVLIPEGLIEFIPEIKNLISELNEIIAKNKESFESLKSQTEKISFIVEKLKPDSAQIYLALPLQIRKELIMDRDPHGNVQVSRIETEKLIIELVEIKLVQLKTDGKYKGKFSPLSKFLGYEGRCAAPSNFDADYCYSLGYTAAALINSEKTGYMALVKNLSNSAEHWEAGGVPMTMMMNIERRHGEDRPVIKKAFVDLESRPFMAFLKNRENWAIEDDYLYPGPIQYFGSAELCDQITETLKLEHKK